MKFSYKSVKHVLETIWAIDLKAEADADLQQILESSGYILRGDHTYKFVKSLGGYDSTIKDWVLQWWADW